MWILISLGLAVAWLITWRRLRGHRLAVRRLREALRRRQPLLQEAEPAAADREWTELCRAVNDQIEEGRRLQHQQHGQLTQLEATLGSLQEAVLIADARNVIQLANRALQAIFPRVTRTQGQRLEVVLHSADFLNYVEAVRGGSSPAQQEMEFVTGADTRWVEVTGATIPPLDEQPGDWVLFVLHDITRQKQLERIRKEFVANVSHELRTPLSVIKGYIETLADGHQQMAVEERDRFLRTAQRHADRLNSLLEDLLTLSRLESANPGLRPEAVAFDELLNTLATDYRQRPAASAHHLTFAAAPDTGVVWLDRLKVCQVFENLLDNALKYTPAGSTVTVDVRRADGQIVGSVRDNGPGIPTADLPHIFERFYRVEKGRSREKGGTGLGLSIVKHIVQLHGGRVWAESEEGRGTVIGFSLPAATPPPATSAAARGA